MRFRFSGPKKSFPPSASRFCPRYARKSPAGQLRWFPPCAVVLSPPLFFSLVQELKRKVATRESACKPMQTIAKRKSAELQARDREEKTKKLATEKEVAKPSSAPGLSGNSLACSSRKTS